MDYYYLLWAACGALLGILYTYSIQREILHAQRNKQKIVSSNPLFSVLRIVFCSAVLILGLYHKIQYGLTCLILFLVFKNLSLFFLVKKGKGPG